MLLDEGGLTLSVPGQPASKQTFLRPSVFPSVPGFSEQRGAARTLGGGGGDMQSTASLFPITLDLCLKLQSQPQGGLALSSGLAVSFDGVCALSENKFACCLHPRDPLKLVKCPQLSTKG